MGVFQVSQSKPNERSFSWIIGKPYSLSPTVGGMGIWCINQGSIVYVYIYIERERERERERE